MLQLFQYETQDIEVVLVENVPWFHAAQVAKALGYSNPTQALQDNVSDKYIQQIDLGKPGKKPNFVSEPGLYQLVIRSTLPSAEKFQDWVFEEVLPAIRQKGSYSINEVIPNSTSERVLQMLEAMQAEFNEKMYILTERTQRLDAVEQELAQIEEASIDNPGCAGILKDDDTIEMTSKEYCEAVGIDKRHWNTISTRAAQFQRVGKGEEPNKKRNGRVLLEVRYLRQATQSVLRLA